jgi:hypothetical protein
MSATDIIGHLLEVFTIIGVAVAALCFLVWFSIRMADGRWHETTAVILRDEDRDSVRWLTEDNTLHTLQLDDDTADDLAGEESVTVFYSVAASDRIRFERRGGAERLLWTLFIVFASTGAGSIIGSLVLTIATGTLS